MPRKKMLVLLALLPASLAALAFTWPYDNPQARQALAELRMQLEPSLAVTGRPMPPIGDAARPIELEIRVLHICVTDATGCLFAEGDGKGLIAATLKQQDRSAFERALCDVDGVELAMRPRVVILSGETAAVNVGAAGRIPPRTLIEVTATEREGSGLVLDATVRSWLRSNQAGKPDGPMAATNPIRLLLPSGDTLVVGGLRQMCLESRRTDIPLLSDLPHVGAYFSYTHDSTAECELVFTVTRRAIRLGT